MLFHFTYITKSLSGKYYVGRHSTSNINDNYQGSGKWVSSCKRNNTELQTSILNFYDSFDELIVAEKLLINEHIENPRCMNFNNNSVGFSIGSMNPSHQKETISKRPQNNKGATTGLFCYDNPSKRPEVKLMRSNKAKELWNTPEYRELFTGENHWTNGEKKEEHSKRMKENNPMFSESTLKIKSEQAKLQRLNEPILKCPHCEHQGKGPIMMRWHFNRCKNIIRSNSEIL